MNAWSPVHTRYLVPKNSKRIFYVQLKVVHLQPLTYERYVNAPSRSPPRWTKMSSERCIHTFNKLNKYILKNQTIIYININTW